MSMHCHAHMHGWVCSHGLCGPHDAAMHLQALLADKAWLLRSQQAKHPAREGLQHQLQARVCVQAELMHAVGLQPKDCIRLGSAFTRVMAFSLVNLQAKLRFLREEVTALCSIYPGLKGCTPPSSCMARPHMLRVLAIQVLEGTGCHALPGEDYVANGSRGGEGVLPSESGLGVQSFSLPLS